MISEKHVDTLQISRKLKILVMLLFKISIHKRTNSVFFCTFLLLKSAKSEREHIRKQKNIIFQMHCVLFNLQINSNSMESPLPFSQTTSLQLPSVQSLQQLKGIFRTFRISCFLKKDTCTLTLYSSSIPSFFIIN